jgi:DNA invertase Pin-like site-specific DNA recombinase
MVYGYARCSTDEDKQDIERQIRDITVLGADIIFREYISASETERPELMKLFDALNSGDRVIVTELSRLTRCVRELCDIIALSLNKSIKLTIGSLTIDFTNGLDPMHEVMLLIMGIFSQMERKMTIQRVKSGMEHARKNGVRLGRPPMSKINLPKIFIINWKRFKDGTINKSEYARICNVSRSTLYKYIEIMEG